MSYVLSAILTPLHANERSSSLPGGLLHHIAQLSGHDQLTLAGHDGHLSGQKFSAQLGPSQSGSDTDFDLCFDLSIPKLYRAEIFVETFRTNLNVRVTVLAHHLYGNFTADGRNLSLQITNTGLFCIVANHAKKRVIRKN